MNRFLLATWDKKDRRNTPASQLSGSKDKKGAGRLSNKNHGWITKNTLWALKNQLFLKTNDKNDQLILT